MRGHQKPPPQTTTQRTAKHRLAVKERLQRYEAALEAIVVLTRKDNSLLAEQVFAEALDAISPITTTKTPE